MNNAFINSLTIRHINKLKVPSSRAVCEFTTGLLQLLFPEISEKRYTSDREVSAVLGELETTFLSILSELDLEQFSLDKENAVTAFFEQVPAVYDNLRSDILAILGGDPAAQSEFEIIRAYPGFHAIAMYRIAHALHLMNIPFIPRIISEFAHTKTGIDIHPGASIGSFFCIDHGTGIVIGETSIIGNHVKLYQGVTLGALSVDKSMASVKRHPTIEDHVVIYAGATILGGATTVGNNSVIGGNVWLTKSVPSYSVVYHKPQIEVSSAERRRDIPN